MRILVVAATPAEAPGLPASVRRRHDVDLLVAGVGMVATAAACARALALQRYDLAVNAGVCGAFDRALPPGTVVHVTSDRLSELGVEDGDRFVPLDRIGLVETTEIVNTSPPVNPVLAALPAVRGVTVNTVHGNEESIARVVALFQPQVESMEGAAFAHACAAAGVPYAQVRAVSNIVERRNRAAWRLDEAVRNLHGVLSRMLDCFG